MPQIRPTPWDPIAIKMLKGYPRIFGNVDDALFYLLYEWPATRGEAHRMAVEACELATQQEAPPLLARAHFERTCIDAGMHPVGEIGSGAQRRSSGES